MLLEVTDQNVDNVIAKSGLVIVDFWSTWCSPCNMLNPVIKSLAEKNGDVTFGKLNTVENLPVARKYGVDAIPQLFFFKDGVFAKKILGYHSENALQKMIDELK